MRRRTSITTRARITIGVITGTVLLGIVSLGGCRTTQGAPAADERTTAVAETAPSPFLALRTDFRTTYDDARDAVDEALSPVVVVRFSDVYLIERGAVTAQSKGIPRKYHMLHRTAHVPLTVYLRLRPHFGDRLPADAATGLEGYAAKLRAAREDLQGHGFTPHEIEQQQLVFDRTLRFLAGLSTGKPVHERDFASYRASVAGPMMTLADIAGAAQVDALHETMTAWWQKLTDEEWTRLRVVIVGPRQPRHDYSATQYFAALFPGRSNSVFPGESDRVFYVESPAIDMGDTAFEAERRAVATLLLDADASAAFFNDPYRMSIDVMADGAAKRVAELDLGRLQTGPKDR